MKQSVTPTPWCGRHHTHAHNCVMCDTLLHKPYLTKIYLSHRYYVLDPPPHTHALGERLCYSQTQLSHL